MNAPTPAFDVMTCPLDGISLVEASAGTGKTWNICGLYLRLLLERALEVRQILVVTFTNAATAELRERVRTRIAETLAWIDGRDTSSGDAFVPHLIATLEARGLARDAMRGRLDLALQSFDEASIFTIHGFCQRALGETAFTAGTPFALDLLPDDRELRMEVVHDFWRRHVAGAGGSPLVATWLLQKNDSPAKYAKLLQRRLDKPWARAIWPHDLERPLALDPAPLAVAYAAARSAWEAQRPAIVELLGNSAALHKGTFNAKSIARSAQDWDAYFRADDPLAAVDPKGKLHLCRAAHVELNTNKGKTPPAHPFCDLAETLLVHRASLERDLSLARLRLLRTLLAEGPPALRDRKRQRRVVSYQDLLFNLYTALHDDRHRALAATLRDRFPAALIDEFQDTDPLQFAIFDRIYGDGRSPLFLVGDPKQAIYSFRHADLYTYLAARQRATAAYTLAANQRSTPGLIDAVNTLFGRNGRALMLPGLEFFPAEAGARPRPAWFDAAPKGSDLRVWMLPQSAEGMLLDRREAKAAAVRATAAEIARLLSEAAAGRIGIAGHALRPVEIAVLVRRHAEGSEVRQALAALGIGSVELSQESVFCSTDAEDVDRVLAALLEPANSKLLRSALATELLGFDATAIALFAVDEPAAMAHRERFAAYRALWLRSGLGVMFRALLSAEGVSGRMLARADGERRLTNLLHLAERLHHAAETHASPDALLRWFRAQRSEDAVDEVAQLRLESDRNLVQIVTVHKAKGLEFPVVFCPFLWDGRPFPAGSGADASEYHAPDGTPVIDFRDDAELGIARAAITEQVRLERAAETIRLDYVALTRASHRCYLVAGCYTTSSFGRSSSKESTRSLLNWLVAGAAFTPDAWFGNVLAPPAIAQAWSTLAALSPSSLVCGPLPTAPAIALVRNEPAADSLFARPPPATIENGWRIGSFSALHQGTIREVVASDHDTRVVDLAPARRVVPPDLAGDDILRFPRGTRAGECIHAVLEHIDFTDASTWRPAIDRALLVHPQSLPGLSRHEQAVPLARMLTNMLDAVLRTTLADGIRLDAIPAAKRLVELEFSLPSPRLTAHALDEALRSLGYAVSPLAFRQLSGYLKGFVDLVFEHAGRYYVLDWKSNHLGYAAADYDPRSLAVAMAEHGYHLQYLLYSIALSRYLAQRIPGYRHATHFGGVLYLFVRGVRPGWTTPDGSASGVYFTRPASAALQILDALFDRHPAAVDG